MGNRYAWIQVKITTENRDRMGGHGHAYATDDMGYCEPYSADVAKFVKRKQRRKQRREHNRITAQAVRSFYVEDTIDLYEEIMEEHDRWYEEEVMFSAYEEKEYDYLDYQNDYSSDYNDPLDYYDPYDDYGYVDDYYSARSYAREEDPHDRIIKPEDAGKSLGEILQEIIDRKEGR